MYYSISIFFGVIFFSIMEYMLLEESLESFSLSQGTSGAPTTDCKIISNASTTKNSWFILTLCWIITSVDNQCFSAVEFS